MDLNDKLSIKNLLFTKAIPNYEIPIPVDGHKLFVCTDCGDKFIFESSYDYHINRKSVHIVYTCRLCNQTKVFFNRCRFLQHIRSHAFKTASINVSDLKVEPIPLGVFKTAPTKQKNVTNTQTAETSKKPAQGGTVCYECKQIIIGGPAYKDRANHFMRYTNETHSCPICLFTLPTVCGLKTHIRFHLKLPPYFCPECGIHIPNKSVQYPFNHDCDGFKMMRATARLQCPVSDCQLLHPNDFKDHMKVNHLKKVYKCPFCVVACFNAATMENHLKGHNIELNRALIFHQCEICPGRLVVQHHMENHLRSHTGAHVFPCWSCGSVFNNAHLLVDHHMKNHKESVRSDNVKEMFKNIVEEFNTGVASASAPVSGQAKRVYRVVKRCDQCNRNFTYKCKYSEISVLPNECPFKCRSKLRSETAEEIYSNMITCTLCNLKISQNWDSVKSHFARKHKNHRCLEAKIVLKKINIRKYLKQKSKRKLPIAKRLRSRKPDEDNKDHETDKQEASTTPTYHVTNANNKCNMCDYVCDTKQTLELHMTIHRDPCMAYQCMECGQSFVVKPSFSKHLLLEHNISEVDEYIAEKKCYNEDALEKYQDINISNEPLKENQCKICREQFKNCEDLEKHFRTHGMAFLLKSTSNKN